MTVRLIQPVVPEVSSEATDHRGIYRRNNLKVLIQARPYATAVGAYIEELPIHTRAVMS
jgi:hypothetical protein